MTDAEFQSRVTADIKALVARCVCGVEDLPDVQRVSSYRQAYRITCDGCGRIYYAPTQTEALIDWERIGAKTFDAQEMAEPTKYLSTKSYAAGRLDGWSSAQTKTSAALLAGVNKVLAMLDDEADVVDGEHGNQMPNTAMRYAQELREAIAQTRETK